MRKQRACRRSPPSACLRALTSAALALPGVAGSIAPPDAQASTEDSIRLQVGRYEEDARSLPGVKSRFDPIEVDFLRVGASAGISDRVTLALDYFQDTWSGASPVATAPRSFFGNRASAPDGVSGATPFIQGSLYFDSDLQVLEADRFGQLSGRRDKTRVHTLSSASPETRKEIALGLEYQWDDAALEVGGRVSTERDYLSGAIRLAGRLDFDQKRTVLRLGSSYAESAIDARFDHDAIPYIDTSAYQSSVRNVASGSPVLRERRSDWMVQIGLSRILNAGATLETSLQARRSAGYLGNPYKVVEVAFIDPSQQGLAPPGGFFGDVHALLERRPQNRHQIVWSTRLLQDVELVRGALSLEYKLHHDDWGIDAHTLEAQWRQQIGSDWLVVPRVRYYTQGAAEFYKPLLITRQAFVTIETDPGGNILSVTPFDPGLLPDRYSGDHRLSAFGVLSAGLVVQKTFLRSFHLELGFEYARHAGSLRIGGGGEGRYADFDSWLVNAGLRIDLTGLALAGGRPARDSRGVVLREDPAANLHPGGISHSHAHGLSAPAGVRFAHTLSRAGDFMIGYRTVYMRRQGDLSTGSRVPTDAAIVQDSCGSVDCSVAARTMTRQMHMLDLMVAPLHWLTLAAMPSFVDSDMKLRALEGGPVDVHSNHDQHSTGGVGDTLFGAMARFFERESSDSAQSAHVALMLSAPTGDTGIRFRRDHQEERGFLHYGMQLGSGTWDLLPSATYAGRLHRFRWGAQLAGVVRLEDEGSKGFALGDEVQLSAWAGIALSEWLEASLRGIYAWQGRIHGRYDRPSSERTPADQPGNYGGEFWDLGIGLVVQIPRGAFEGMRLSIEWQQPLAEDFRGVQLERTGTLAANWSIPF